MGDQISVGEAAWRYDVRKETVNRWLKEGKIKNIGFWKEFPILDVDDIEEAIAEGRIRLKAGRPKKKKNDESPP